MNKAVLTRLLDDGTQTLGVLDVYDALQRVFTCKTLEPAWLNNEPRRSCIPIGIYWVEPRESQKFGHHFHIQNVPGREFVLFHPGNSRPETEGCVLVGYDYADITNDGKLDVIRSRFVFERLLQVAKEGFLLTVVSCADLKRGPDKSAAPATNG